MKKMYPDPFREVDTHCRQNDSIKIGWTKGFNQKEIKKCTTLVEAISLGSQTLPAWAVSQLHSLALLMKPKVAGKLVQQVKFDENTLRHYHKVEGKLGNRDYPQYVLVAQGDAEDARFEWPEGLDCGLMCCSAPYGVGAWTTPVDDDAKEFDKPNRFDDSEAPTQNELTCMLSNITKASTVRPPLTPGRHLLSCFEILCRLIVLYLFVGQLRNPRIVCRPQNLAGGLRRHAICVLGRERHVVPYDSDKGWQNNQKVVPYLL